jgi:predicted ATPase
MSDYDKLFFHESAQSAIITASGAPISIRSLNLSPPKEPSAAFPKKSVSSVKSVVFSLFPKDPRNVIPCLAQTPAKGYDPLTKLMHVNRITVHGDQFPTSESYPFNLPLIRAVGSLDLSAPVTFFAGDNGSGKSTLLEAITERCGIYIWQGVTRERYKFNPYEKALYQYVSVDWNDGKVPGSFFGAGIFRNFAQLLDEWAASDPGVLELFGGRSLMTLSHGQSLMAFFRNRFFLKGLYILDEPETALSPKTQLELLSIIAESLKTGHVQYIIATHSPILLACPGSVIYDFNAMPLVRVNYEDTEHYRVYKDFLNDYRKYL